MNDKLTMTVSLKVQGKEGLDLTLTYADTTMETVMLVEKALLSAIGGLLDKQ